MPSAERVKARRLELGLTQAQLARCLRDYLPQADEVLISKIERKVRRISADELPAFAKCLSCLVQDLLDQMLR